jgi:23S rRNA (cytosine1962-C5)-methyltransferase
MVTASRSKLAHDAVARLASFIKSRRNSPPEAIPFVRGRQPRPAAARPSSWIDPSTWLALQAQQTDAHRLATGADWWLERFGPDLLLSHATEAGRVAAVAEIEKRCADYAFTPARVFGKHLPQQAAERGAPVLLRGDASASLETEVREAGVRFGLDFAAGYSAGFFIDQRENRAQVRRLAPGRMLNTFAYTCSFSIIAALAGAETVSIDLSRRSLTRGEENFTRNGLDPRGGRHRFIADDVLAVLPRLARRGDKFDVIVLDPPTFSRNQSGAAWRVQDDFGKLVELALEVAAPRAHVLLSVNHSGMRAGDLEQVSRAALRSRSRAGKFMRTAALPDFPPGHGASTIWLELGN